MPGTNTQKVPDRWRNRPDTITGNAKVIVKNYIALKMIALEEKGEPVSKPSEIEPVGAYREPPSGLTRNTSPNRLGRRTGSISYVRRGVSQKTGGNRIKLPGE